jgi:hypothetical protein
MRAPFHRSNLQTHCKSAPAYQVRIDVIEPSAATSCHPTCKCPLQPTRVRACYVNSIQVDWVDAKNVLVCYVFVMIGFHVLCSICISGLRVVRFSLCQTNSWSGAGNMFKFIHWMDPGTFQTLNALHLHVPDSAVAQSEFFSPSVFARISDLGLKWTWCLWPFTKRLEHSNLSLIMFAPKMLLTPLALSSR